MALARASGIVELPRQRAFELWTDARRWGSFVEGMSSMERLDGEWPEPGAKLVWRSIPQGRGRVTERVVENAPPARFATEVFEERLHGTQTVIFEAGEEEGTAVALELEYELVQKGPLRTLADVLFIRRALSDALARTLRRFAVEAAEEAAR